MGGVGKKKPKPGSPPATKGVKMSAIKIQWQIKESQLQGLITAAINPEDHKTIESIHERDLITPLSQGNVLVNTGKIVGRIGSFLRACYQKGA